MKQFEANLCKLKNKKLINKGNFNKGIHVTGKLIKDAI